METKLNPQEEAKNKRKKQFNTFLSKYFNLVIAIVVVIILIVAAFTLILPKYNSIIKSIEESVYQKEKIYLQQYKKLNESKQLIALYKSVNFQDVDKLNNIIPQPYRYEDLFAEVESIVVKNGFIMKSMELNKGLDNIAKNKAGFVNINNPVLPPDIEQVKVNLTVLGMDYYGLKYLIQLLETNLKLIDIVEINFEPEGNSVDLEFWTYYLKDSNN